VDLSLGFKFFTRKVSTTSTVSPPFPWKIQEWSSSGNGNLKTTNQRAEIAFNRLLKVPFVNPPKDAKNSASSAVKFVNQYSGLGHAALKFCLDWVSLAWVHTFYLRLESYVLGRKCADITFCEPWIFPEHSQNAAKTYPYLRYFTWHLVQKVGRVCLYLGNSQIIQGNWIGSLGEVI